LSERIFYLWPKVQIIMQTRDWWCKTGSKISHVFGQSNTCIFVLDWRSELWYKMYFI